MITVKFSGLLRQVAGRAEMNMELPASRRLSDVLAALATAYPGILGASVEYQWRHGSSHVMVAVNGRVVEEGGEGSDVELAEGDEVMLLAPLGGG